MNIKDQSALRLACFLLFFWLTPEFINAQDESGCLDPIAVNYNPYASDDDGSCLYAGCLNPFACNYAPDADVDGICEYPGCNDQNAINFTPDASCFDEDVCDYNDNTLVEIEVYAIHTGIVGNTDLTGYITSRIYAKIGVDDQFSAIYGLLEEDNSPDGSDIEVITDCDTFDETNVGGFLGRDHDCNLYPTFPELAFDSYLTINQASSCDPGNTYVAVSSPLDYDQGNIGDLFIDDGAIFVLQNAANASPDEEGNVFIAQMTTCGDLGMKFCIQYYIGGELANQATECIICSFSFGCTDPQAPNFNPYANTDDASCLPAMLAGCTNPEACNYDPVATLNTVCFYPECTDPSACNYVEAAFCEDESTCIYFEAASLDGLLQVEAGNVVAYTYLSDPSGDYTWTIEGGVIIEYLENNEVLIEWGAEGSGSITITHNTPDCSGTVGPIEVTIDEVTLIPQEGAQVIKAYPNPSSEILYVEVPASLVQKTYLLTDDSGKMMSTGLIRSIIHEINVDELSAGWYTLAVEGAPTVKVLIQR